MVLYVFAGFPGKDAPSGSQHLHAGGLQYCIEDVEELGLLEHDPAVQYRKEGVFAANTDEMLYPIEYRMSEMCLRDGITWDWFSENWGFGNGVTMHKTSASPDYKTVVHGTELNLDEFLTEYGTSRLAELELERIHVRHEGWKEYESRWLPGTCPQEKHAVHLTWLVTAYRLPEFAYERIKKLVEYGAEPERLGQYSSESGHHFSTIRRFEG
jgi:hypothetical protein